VLLREINAVCCGNCGKLGSADFVPIRDLTIILPVVLFRCGTWSLTLSEEHRLRLFENRVFRRMFRPKRD
jgi:hypothetical protein